MHVRSHRLVVEPHLLRVIVVVAHGVGNVQQNRILTTSAAMMRVGTASGSDAQRKQRVAREWVWLLEPWLAGQGSQVLPANGEFVQPGIKPPQTLLDLIDRPHIVVARRASAQHGRGVKRQSGGEARVEWAGMKADGGAKIEATDSACLAVADEGGSPDTNRAAYRDHDAGWRRVAVDNRGVAIERTGRGGNERPRPLGDAGDEHQFLEKDEGRRTHRAG